MIKMEIAVIPPQVFPATWKPERYGSEFIWAQLADSLDKTLDVTLFGAEGSQCRRATVRETVNPQGDDSDEKRAYEIYSREIEKYDLIIDATHQYLPYQIKHKPIIHVANGVQTRIPWIRNKMCLVTLSEWHRKDTFTRFGRPSIVIPYGIDPGTYTVITDKEDYILYFGLIAEHKGPYELARNWRVDENPLIVAGEDEFGVSQGYVEKVQTKCREKNIEYYGRVSGPAKIKLISHAKAVVLPFLRPEAFSLIALESMLMGTPVVSTDMSDGVPATAKCSLEDMQSVAASIASQPHLYRQNAEEIYSHSKMIAEYLRAIDEINNGWYW